MYFRGYVSDGSYLYQYRKQEHKSSPDLTHMHQLTQQAKCRLAALLQHAHAPTQEYTHTTHTHTCKSGKLKREQVHRLPGRLVPFSHNQLEGNMTNSMNGVIKSTTLEDKKTWQQIAWLKVLIILYIMNVWCYTLFYTANYSHNYVPTDIRIFKLCCWWPCHCAIVAKKRRPTKRPLEFCDCQKV
jgi:hypothetical protein